MKLFPNPITSPSRLDKFQSPLKRSLRKNGVGSRSRGRSRSSPMFIRKKNEVLVETQQEPSSPKVTCFGQVRVRKSKSGRHNKPRCCCCCCSIRKALCCSSRFDGKSKPSRSFRSVWERWFLFTKVGFRSKRRESIQTIQEVTEEEEEEEEDEGSDEEEEEENTEEDEEVGGGGRRVISSSPPKNALLLMRSKSESYRPSSLANLFWGSPVSVKEEIRIPEIITEQRSDAEEEENEERPTSEKELTCRDSTSESRKNGSKIENDEIESSSSSSSFRSSTTTNIRSSSKIEDESGRNPVQAPALPNTVVLRRSKSEPASRGISVKLDSLENWKEEIYNNLDPSSIHQTRKEEEKEGRDSLY